MNIVEMALSYEKLEKNIRELFSRQQISKNAAK